MVVLMVTLFMRVTMRRSTVNSASFSLLKATSAGALVLAFAVACSDSNGPRVPKDGIPVDVQQVEVIIPDSVKMAADQFTATLLAPPRAISANGFASPTAVFSRSSSGCSTGGSNEYTVENLPLPFTPEPIPIYTPSGGVTQDGWIADLPLEFNFVFFGNTYDKVNVYSNGFLKFGTPPTTSGFANGDRIPDPALPNNIIALAWGDWEPMNIPGAIRFETRGRAPNRMFILQFNNVPEWPTTTAKGLLMAQLVLHEGSNAISMYTNTMSTTRLGARVTQGIENADGTVAYVGDSVLLANGMKTPRVRAVFKLTEDQIRFTPARVLDTEAPSISAPANIEDYHNDPGLGSAAIASVGSPEASDNCALQGDPVATRSDGAALDAPYPVGVTTITWTARDAAGNVATASQSIEVIDVEDPIITFVPADFSVNATSSLGAMVSYAFTAQDNVGVTSQSCVPELGSRLPIGATEVTCSASDAAGHAVSKSFVVTVIDAPTQMMNLIEYVISRGMPEGMTNPLVNQLQEAFANAGTAHGCKKMNDFLALVEVKGVPGAWADYMFSEAQRIMTVMQCSEVAQARRGKLKNK
jgi:hypothetical protein